jgi:hypothetical protein
VEKERRGGDLNASLPVKIKVFSCDKDLSAGEKIPTSSKKFEYAGKQKIKSIFHYTLIFLRYKKGKKYWNAEILILLHRRHYQIIFCHTS